MGIFGRNRSQHHSSGGSTIISSGTQLDGSLTLTDNLHIDGKFEGDIESKADVALGDEGRFVGTIRARNVFVSGQLKGRVTADRLEIVAGGAVDGEIEVCNLVIEPGGQFNGSSTIRGDESAQIEAEPVETAQAAKKKASANDKGLAESSA